jgi:plastocyanin
MARRQQRGTRRGRKLGLVAGAVFACLALGGRAATASEAAGPQILIENFRFDPPTLEVPVGTTVTWMNKDEEIHVVTSSQGLFRSPGLEGDQQFAHRFEKPGTYEYGCAIHPQMKGTIVVR